LSNSYQNDNHPEKGGLINQLERNGKIKKQKRASDVSALGRPDFRKARGYFICLSCLAAHAWYLDTSGAVSSSFSRIFPAFSASSAQFVELMLKSILKVRNLEHVTKDKSREAGWLL